MSTGTLCLICRKYLKGDPRWVCSCAHPIPSDDGVTPNETHTLRALLKRARHFMQSDDEFLESDWNEFEETKAAIRRVFGEQEPGARPATPAATPPATRRSLPFRSGDIVEHRKGGQYRVEGIGTIEKTMTEAYAYRGHDGRLWFRPIAEMEDGRFKKVGHEPSTDNGAPMQRLFGAVTRLFAEINRAGPP